MTRKMYWGLGVLIVVFIGAFVFVMVNQHAEIKQLEAEAKKAQDKANQINQQKNFKNNPPPDEPGFTWVWHHNHWDKVPINNPIGPIEDHNAPPTDISNDSDANYVEFSMSEEELARVREIDLEYVPKRIEFYKNAIPRAEERYNNLSIYFQKYPDSDNKWLREQLEHHKKTLDMYKQQLSSAEYRLDLIRKEEMEANNEKK